MSERIYNFNAGPAILPLAVLDEIQAELINFKGSGMSIIEISHRSPWFETVLDDAVARIKRLMGLNDDYHVLFLQGGASMQFCMVPMNLLPEGQAADYVNTGTWATNAIKEAKILGKTVHVVASSEDKNFSYIPKNIRFTPGAAYVHVTSNNTIKGTQWASFPNTGPVPIVCDMSSDILSRSVDPAPFGLMYAGAQKNLGPAGVTLVVIREDMLKRTPETLSTMLKYTTHAAKKSMYNTPPCFAIYVVQLVLKWLEETVGGIAEIEKINKEKSALLYQVLDNNPFYKGTAEKDSRSLMNITFLLPTEALEKQFVQEAVKNGLGGLKGHRSVGGCRASIYNAMPIEGVRTLVAFMNDFARKNG